MTRARGCLRLAAVLTYPELPELFRFPILSLPSLLITRFTPYNPYSVSPSSRLADLSPVLGLAVFGKSRR